MKPEAAEASRQNRVLWIVLGAALAVLVLVLVLFMRSGGPGVTQAPGADAGPPVTLAPPASPGPPVTSAPPRPAPQPARPDPMREAVVAYLAQVEQIEAQRKAVVNNLVPAMATAALARQMSGLTALFDQLDPDFEQGMSRQPQNPAADQARATIDGYLADLQNLSRRLSGLRPPPPANALQIAYYRGFQTYIQVLLRIRSSLDAAPGQEQQVAAQLQSEAPQLESAKTRALAAADAELQKLTQQYGLERRFSISDQAEQSILR